jgi:hypothetical protein
MGSMLSDQEKFTLSCKQYENADCIYKEGWNFYYARVSNIEVLNSGMKANVQSILAKGLPSPHQTTWHIGASWGYFSFFDDEYWRCARLWTLYFNPILIEEVIALAAVLPLQWDEESKFEQLAKHINFNHELRINQLESEADFCD